MESWKPTKPVDEIGFPYSINQPHYCLGQMRGPRLKDLGKKLETDSKKPGQDQKITTHKEPTILELSS